MQEWFEIEEIISQIVRISWVCDQNGDRVSKNDKSCHICRWDYKGFSKNMENMGLCL